MAAGARRARSTLGAGGDSGITIIAKVAGSVISERDLVEVVRRGLTRTGTANGTIGGLTRRASPATIHNPRIADTNGGTYVTAQSRSPRLGSAEGKSTSGGSGTLRAPTGKGELGLDAGTIAVIASVLVLAYQARSLATHARIANEVAGAEANRELLTWWHDSVFRVFVVYPETRALL